MALAMRVPWSHGYKNQFQVLSLMDYGTLEMSLCKLADNGESVLRPIMHVCRLPIEGEKRHAPESWRCVGGRPSIGTELSGGDHPCVDFQLA